MGGICESTSQTTKSNAIRNKQLNLSPTKSMPPKINSISLSKPASKEIIRKRSKLNSTKHLEHNLHINNDDNSNLNDSMEFPFKEECIPQPIFDFDSTCNQSTYDKDTNNDAKKQFKGRTYNRSISLIEKQRLSSLLYKDEMRLRVKTQALVDATQGLPNEKYKVIKKIGDGTFGTVYLAENTITNLKVALKCVSKSKMKDINDKEKENSTQAEIDIVKQLDHPNIVKIIEYYSTNDNYYVINDYYSYGELFTLIKKNLTEEEIAYIFYQILSGVYYLHSQKIIHRDLKLENILISRTEPINENDDSKKFYTIKIIDFGTAKKFSKTKSESKLVGTSYYIAPEVLKGKYNEKCDIWSIGVLLYMFIVGKPPFNGLANKEVFENIRNGKLNNNNPRFKAASSEVKDLIRKLLDVHVENRLSAKEALEHKWFDKHKSIFPQNNLDPEFIKVHVDNLLNYSIKTKFQQMILAFIVHNIDENMQEVIEIEKIFRLFNTDHSGNLTKEQLLEGLKNIYKDNQLEHFIDDLFEVLHCTQTNYIQYEEFLLACLDKKKLLSDNVLLYAFSFIAKNKNGSITLDKLLKAFVGQSGKIDAVDVNSFRAVFDECCYSKKEKVLSFREFKEIMVNV